MIADSSPETELDGNYRHGEINLKLLEHNDGHAASLEILPAMLNNASNVYATQQNTFRDVQEPASPDIQPNLESVKSIKLEPSDFPTPDIDVKNYTGHRMVHPIASRLSIKDGS